MPELVWYRSLYWRIAIGFVALLAVLLAAQGTAFLWLTGRMSELLPGRSPQEYSAQIAADLVVTMGEKPDTDLDTYLNDRYRGTYRPFVVVTRDNRTVVSRRIQPPQMLVRAAYGGSTMPMEWGAARGQARAGVMASRQITPRPVHRRVHRRNGAPMVQARIAVRTGAAVGDSAGVDPAGSARADRVAPAARAIVAATAAGLQAAVSSSHRS
jgi:hypothetical protein